MSYSEAQLRDLLHQAGHLPYGPGQIALVEQVIKHADALHCQPYEQVREAARAAQRTDSTEEKQ